MHMSDLSRTYFFSVLVLITWKERIEKMFLDIWEKTCVVISNWNICALERTKLKQTKKKQNKKKQTNNQLKTKIPFSPFKT